MSEPPRRPHPSEHPSEPERAPVVTQAEEQRTLHQSDADDEDENVKQLNECSALYLSLQDCLVKTNRNWKSCQAEVQALKACHERRKK